jgi:hypothetical protein
MIVRAEMDASFVSKIRNMKKNGKLMKTDVMMKRSDEEKVGAAGNRAKSGQVCDEKMKIASQNSQQQEVPSVMWTYETIDHG